MGQAWVDLILLANHKDGTIIKRNQVIPVKRGQVGHSILDLSIRWKWSQGKVKRFLKNGEQNHEIRFKSRERLTTIITLINYEKYQDNKQTENKRRTEPKKTEINNNNIIIKNKEVGPVQLKNGTKYHIPKQDIERWKNTYTHIDVLMILKEIVEWNHNNPKKRKTQSGITKHITTWLAKENKETWKRLNQPTAEAAPRQKYIADIVKERGF